MSEILKDNEPVAWRVHDVAVPRSHSKAQTPDIHDAALYPASRENDAREYARIIGGECQPLYTHLPVSDGENAEGKCQESDGCPTEKAVLQRFWRAHHNTRQQPAISAQVQDVARCRDCDGYNCDDGCAYPDAEPNQPKDAE